MLWPGSPSISSGKASRSVADGRVQPEVAGADWGGNGVGAGDGDGESRHEIQYGSQAQSIRWDGNGQLDGHSAGRSGIGGRGFDSGGVEVIEEGTAVGRGRGDGGIVPPNWIRRRNHAVTPSPQTYVPTFEERLRPTLDLAKSQAASYERTARLTSFLVYLAFSLQVLVGALITGVANTGPKGAQISSVLGGTSMIITIFLARTHGSGEPMVSIDRARDLQKFIRKCEATILDWGHERPDPLSPNPFPRHIELLQTIDQYRADYDELLSAWDGGKSSQRNQGRGLDFEQV